MEKRGAALAVASCLALIALSGCTQVGNDLDAPLKIIPDTDVVVETNLLSAIESAKIELATSGSFTGFGGGTSKGGITTGPSTGPGDISFAVTPGGGGLLLAGWNHADQHCVGTIYVHSSLSSPVLGVSAPATYDFIAPAATSDDCNAAALLGDTTAPTKWPEAPSSSGWSKI